MKATVITNGHMLEVRMDPIKTKKGDLLADDQLLFLTTNDLDGKARVREYARSMRATFTVDTTAIDPKIEEIPG